MKTPPTKTTYYVGEDLDISDAVFEDCITFKNKYGHRSYFDYFNIAPSELTVDSSQFNKWVPGTYTIYVTDNVVVTDADHEIGTGSKTISFTVQVIENQITTTSTSATTTSTTSTTTTTTTSTTTTSTTTTSSTTTTTTTTTTTPPDKPYIIIKQPDVSELYVGNSFELSYEFSDKDAFNSNVWITFDKWNVARISGNKVTIFAAGTDTLTIHCSSKNHGTITAQLTITATEKVPVTPDFLLGDVTLDGIINGSDATLTLSAYTLINGGSSSPLNETQTKAADVDGNGIITATDATLILRYYTMISSGTSSGTPPTLEEWMKNQ